MRVEHDKRANMLTSPQTAVGWVVSDTTGRLVLKAVKKRQRRPAGADYGLLLSLGDRDASQVLCGRSRNSKKAFPPSSQRRGGGGRRLIGQGRAGKLAQAGCTCRVKSGRGGQNGLAGGQRARRTRATPAAPAWSSCCCSRSSPPSPGTTPAPHPEPPGSLQPLNTTFHCWI